MISNRVSDMAYVIFVYACIALIACLPSKVLALDLELGELGFTAIEKRINVGGGVAYLKNADFISFSADYENGPSIVIVDSNGDSIPSAPLTIAHFDKTVYPSFIKVAPSGNFAIIGVTGTLNDISVIDLRNLQSPDLGASSSWHISQIASISGNYDLEFIDNRHVYISANPSMFDPSSPNLIYWMDLDDPLSLKPVVSVSGPSGPIALSSAKDLYYIQSVWTYPAPPLGATLLKFSKKQLDYAHSGNEPLNKAASLLSVAIDGGYDLAVESSTKREDTVYIAGLEDGILKYNVKTGIKTFLKDTNQEKNSASFTRIALLTARKPLKGCYSDNKLLTGVAYHSYSENAVVEVLPIATNQDLDAYNDCIEESFGSDPLDAGSTPDVLFSPAYGHWTTSAKTDSVLELANLSNTENHINVILYDNAGKLVDKFKFTMKAFARRDLLLNRRASIASGGYGTIELSFNAKINASVVYYKKTHNSDDVDSRVVYSLPLANPSAGEVSAIFNTYFPLSSASAITDNRLSLSNLSADSQKFRITKFDEQGNVLTSKIVKLDSKSRREFDGGHILPGRNKLGMISVKSLSADVPYLTHLVRYGDSTAKGDIDFALGIHAIAGTKASIAGFMQEGSGIQNWLEIANTGTYNTEATLQCYDSTGRSQFNIKMTLRPHSQQRLNLSIPLKTKDMTVCDATAAQGGIIAQSVAYYGRKESSKKILPKIIDSASVRTFTNYATLENKEQLIHKYNSYSMGENELSIANMGSSAANINLYALNSLGRKIFSRTLSVDGGKIASVVLGDAVFRDKENYYGTVYIQSVGSSKLLSDLLRISKEGEFVLKE